MSDRSENRYYVALGKAHDDVLRCKDCQQLITYASIKHLGCCANCGNKRFSEVTTLKQEEYDAIQEGSLVFPDSDKFLQEFSGVPGT